MKFEIGHWYKSNAGSGTCATGFYYLKVLELKGETPYGEGLAEDNCMENHWWSAHQTLTQALELGPMLDLSEIEQYLPVDHPDRKSNKADTTDYKYLTTLLKKLNIT